GEVACSLLRGGFAWHRPYARLAISRGARKRGRHGLGSILGTVLGALPDCMVRLVIAGSEHNETQRSDNVARNHAADEAASRRCRHCAPKSRANRREPGATLGQARPIESKRSDPGAN